MERVKLFLEIINSAVSTIVLIVGGGIGIWWAYYKFGHEEKIRELKSIKFALINFRNNASLFSFYKSLSKHGDFPIGGSLKESERNFELSKSELSASLDSAFYVDHVKIILWQMSLSDWIISSSALSNIENEESRKKLNETITKIQVEISTEAQKHISLFRRFTKYFRK